MARSPSECRDFGAPDDAMDVLEYLVRRMQADSDLRSITGRSSDAMVLSALTGRAVYKTDYPRDRSDWRRCLLAYALAPPVIRDRMWPIMRAYRAALDPRYRTWMWPVKTPSLWMVLDNEKALARV